MTNQRLIRNAAVITVDPELGTLPKADILIAGNRIAAIGKDIKAGDAEAVARDLDVARERVFAAHAAHDMTPYRETFEQMG
ncbi:MAG: hypothetical protein CMM46_11420 [Rhodospirillaceae bacterium]|nr:hypothetical protein [Rhodospirillaceae bacterium]|tara:strand:- start:2728 stop:2970 length:243 start_codon:yes stop_codon:yes gene_type:complete